MTIAEYRKIDAMSYSRMKDFIKKGRRYYYKKYVLKEDVKDEISTAIRIGDAVDCMLFTPDDFDNKFTVGETDNMPTGKGAAFVKHLFELQKAGGTFIDNAREAYRFAELTKPSFETYLENFEGSPLEKMYNSMVEAETKTVIPLNELELSERIVDILKNHKLVGQIFKREGYNQLPVVFDYCGEKFKALFDRVTIDHKKKLIKPYDLKTTFEDEAFHYNFLKNKYYIQQGIYEQAIKVWRDENFPDYEIDPFRFIVVNSSSINQPLVYEITPSRGDFQLGFETEKGGKFKGVEEILREINWHVQNNIWDISKENHNKSNYILQII